MKTVTANQMRLLDQTAITRYGIPSLILMENAGRGIADLAAGLLCHSPVQPGKPWIPRSSLPAIWQAGRGMTTVRGGRVLVICGRGNNGGDGFVAARHLHNRGFKVEVFLIGASQDLKDDPGLNFGILKKMKAPIRLIRFRRDVQAFEERLRRSSPGIIIDAIFGVGLKRPVEGLFRDIIEAVNRSGKAVLSVDIPSGLDSDSGKVLGCAVRSSATGTLGALKRGLVSGDGPKYSGKVTVLDISIPRNLLI